MNSRKVFEMPLHKGIDIFLIIGLFFLFWTFTFGNHMTDILPHAEILQVFLGNKSFPIPPGYYFSLYVVKTILLGDYRLASVLLMTLSVYFKFNFSVRALSTELIGKSIPESTLKLWVISLLLFFPIYLYKIDLSNFFLGKLSPNVWHNSTGIFCTPFVILLFFKTLNFLEGKENKLIYLYLLVTVVLLIKPSFLFVFLPALLIMIFVYPIDMQKRWCLGLLVLFGFIGVLLMKLTIYRDHAELDEYIYSGQSSEVIIAPFRVWAYFSNNLLLSVLTSIVWLVLVSVYYFEKLKKYRSFWFVLLQFIGAILVLILFAETGPREYHLNFYAQVPMAYFIMLLSISIILFKEVDGFPIGKGKGQMLLNAVYLLHIFSGTLFLGKYLYFGTYE